MPTSAKTLNRSRLEPITTGLMVLNHAMEKLDVVFSSLKTLLGLQRVATSNSRPDHLRNQTTIPRTTRPWFHDQSQGKRCAISLNFYRRHVTRHALPLAVRHLHPGVSPTHAFIDRLSQLIGALSFGGTRSDGCIPKYSYFHIFVFHAVIFGGFRVFQQLSPVGEFSIGSRTNKLIGQQRGDQVRIICFL